ncbi:hypothetical protein PX699_12830 [Sphingobium sp. H39-3-25]|uniref:hypothetical protein n=1 Tax=Sphingobium arseniciresistens TaxID=3030834 RepID=UPI0023B95808|nr:hypothetical protein [Sphingobium arseniciresistens]
MPMTSAPVPGQQESGPALVSKPVTKPPIVPAEAQGQLLRQRPPEVSRTSQNLNVPDIAGLIGITIALLAAVQYGNCGLFFVPSRYENGVAACSPRAPSQPDVEQFVSSRRKQ